MVAEAHREAHDRRRQGESAASRAAAEGQPDGVATLMDRHRAIMAPKFAKVLEVFSRAPGQRRRRRVDEAEGRLLHHARCAGRLREGSREAREGGRRGAHASRRRRIQQAMIRTIARSASRRVSPDLAEVAQAAGRRGAVRAARGDAES